VIGRGFFDVLIPPPQLVVLGAGDDAGRWRGSAADVGFRVVVVDRRAGYLTRERFPGAAALVETGDELDAVLPLDADCYAVVMNHKFADDQAYVRALMKNARGLRRKCWARASAPSASPQPRRRRAMTKRGCTGRWVGHRDGRAEQVALAGHRGDSRGPLREAGPVAQGTKGRHHAPTD